MYFSIPHYYLEIFHLVVLCNVLYMVDVNRLTIMQGLRRKHYSCIMEKNGYTMNIEEDWYCNPYFYINILSIITVDMLCLI